MNVKKLPRPLFVGALITANISIVISLMHLTLHFIDSVNFAMGFLKSEVTKALMLGLSCTALITSIFVFIILAKRGSKSYFFRKVAFLTFWVCFLNILVNRNVILPNMVQEMHLKALWFFVSTLSMMTSVFCNGLLVMNTDSDNEATEETKAEDVKTKEESVASEENAASEESEAKKEQKTNKAEA